MNVWHEYTGNAFVLSPQKHDKNLPFRLLLEKIFVNVVRYNVYLLHCYSDCSETISVSKTSKYGLTLTIIGKGKKKLYGLRVRKSRKSKLSLDQESLILSTILSFKPVLPNTVNSI